MTLDGMPVRRTGSQGQCKTFTIALRLAQYEFLREATAMKPMLLLDDIFDKLDASRVERIMAIAERPDTGQIFITDTNRHPSRRNHAPHRWRLPPVGGERRIILTPRPAIITTAMKRTYPQSVAEIIDEVFRANGLTQTVAEQRLCYLWPEIVGPGHKPLHHTQVYRQRHPARVHIVGAAQKRAAVHETITAPAAQPSGRIDSDHRHSHPLTPTPPQKKYPATRT